MADNIIPTTTSEIDKTVVKSDISPEQTEMKKILEQRDLESVKAGYRSFQEREKKVGDLEVQKQVMEAEYQKKAQDMDAEYQKKLSDNMAKESTLNIEKAEVKRDRERIEVFKADYKRLRDETRETQTKAQAVIDAQTKEQKKALENEQAMDYLPTCVTAYYNMVLKCSKHWDNDVRDAGNRLVDGVNELIELHNKKGDKQRQTTIIVNGCRYLMETACQFEYIKVRFYETKKKKDKEDLLTFGEYISDIVSHIEGLLGVNISKAVSEGEDGFEEFKQRMKEASLNSNEGFI